MKCTALIKLGLLIIFSFPSCKGPNGARVADDKQAILSMHRMQRNHHFEKDSVAFVNQLSEHFISVNQGLISSPSKKETLSRYHNYFTSVDFVTWNDYTEPIIRFSDDHSMAYTIVDKLVVVKYADAKGNLIEGKTHFAWTAIYRKYDSEWKIDCVTSTNKPLD